MHNSSSAYDLSLFETKKPELKVIKPNKKKLRQQKRKQRLQNFLSVFSILSVCTIAFCGFGYVLSGNVQLITLNSSISSQEETLNVLDSEYKRLSNDLQTRTSALEVDKYISASGMAKVEPYQVEFVQNSRTDKAVITKELTFLDSLHTFFSDIFG